MYCFLISKPVSCHWNYTAICPASENSTCLRSIAITNLLANIFWNTLLVTCTKQYCYKISIICPGSTVRKSVHLAGRRLVVQIPAATDPSRKKTGSDSSTVERSATGVTVTSPRGLPLLTDVQCQRRCGTLKNSHCSMAIIPSIGQNLRSFAGSGDVSIWVKIFDWDIKPQTNKQRNKYLLLKTFKIQKETCSKLTPTIFYLLLSKHKFRNIKE